MLEAELDAVKKRRIDLESKKQVAEGQRAGQQRGRTHAPLGRDIHHLWGAREAIRQGNAGQMSLM